MVKAFKSTLEDIEEKRSIHSLQYLNRQRPVTEISFIDDELKGNQPDYPYEIRKINILSSLRNHLNNTSLASQLSAHELIGNEDQQARQQLIKEQIKKQKDQGFAVFFKPTRNQKIKSLNQRAFTAPISTINRLPSIRSNSVSNDILVDNLVDNQTTNKLEHSPPTSSSNESPLNNANKNTAAIANNPLVQGYNLMHETSI